MQHPYPVFIGCLAASLDGKIAPAKQPGQGEAWVRFSSDADIDHLKALRSKADAIVVGSVTFRSFPKPLPSSNKAHRPIHVLLTRGDDILKSLPPDAPLFESDMLVMIATEHLPGEEIKDRYPNRVIWQQVAGDAACQVAKLAAVLTELGCKVVQVEGGGQVMALFLQAGMLDELYLTLCSVVFGEGGTPMASGTGAFWPALPAMTLKSAEVVGDEVFCHYVRKTQGHQVLVKPADFTLACIHGGVPQIHTIAGIQ